MRILWNYLEQRVTRRFVATMLGLLLMMVIGASVVLSFNYSTQRHYQSELTEMQRKQAIVAEIHSRTEHLFFAARGYLLFLNNEDYDTVFVEQNMLEASLAEYQQLKLSDEEQELAVMLEGVVKDYIERIFPQYVMYAKNDDLSTISKMHYVETDNAVNETLEYVENLRRDYRKLLNEKSDHLIKQLSYEAWLYLIYIITILLIAIWITTKTSREIGGPLKQLSMDAEKFAHGEYVSIQSTSRKDEIGQLSRSLDYMMSEIHARGEELLAQNEELMAQQDELQAQQEELQMQQDELQHALEIMENNERYLNRRNRLVQSLSITLGKKQLLDSIVQNTVEVMEADKGLIVLLNEERDFAAFGISEQAARQVAAEMEHGIAVRALQTKRPYVVARQSDPNERGYHEETFLCSDLYIPLLNSNDEANACMLISRIGKSVTEQEIEEAENLAKQISLSIAKLEMFEESAKQWRITQDLLDTINEGVQLIDRKGTILQVNRKMCELFGNVDHSQMMDIPLETFFNIVMNHVQHNRELVQFISNVVQETDIETNSIIYEVNYPSYRVIQVYFEPLFRGNERFGTVLVHRDITKEYEVDQMKSEFVSTVSHELRTPLASVLGFTELLLNRELNPERQRKYLTTIHQEAHRLTGLINDFLDLQRIESGKQLYEFQNLDIMPVIEEVIEIQKVNTSIHEFVIDLHTEQTTISADKDKIQQVLMNLIGNAVKYSPEGGSITIRCSDSGQYLQVDIIDEGLGIPQEALPKLFSKFYRIDNSDRREIGGTGLGLAIVKEIVQAHNGNITVESEQGKGSTFTIRFPLNNS